jgi:exopolysaccharide biosynthesis polyprenyl glycosylphosphotransferase
MARRAPGAPADSGRRKATSNLSPAPPSEQVSIVPAPSGRLAFLPADWLPVALVAGDALIAAVAVLATYEYHSRLDFLYRREALSLTAYLVAVPIVMLIYLFALAVSRQYGSWRGRTLLDRLLSLYYGIAFGTILILAAISLTYSGFYYARLTVLYIALVSAVLMTGERYLLREYETRLRRRGIGTERVLMVGTGTASELLIRRMSMFPQYGYLVRGVVEDGRRPGEVVAGAPVVGGVDELPELVRRLGIKQVFIALRGIDSERLHELVRLCEREGIQFQVVPDLFEFMSSRVEASAIDGLPLVGLRRSQLTAGKAAIKRAIDVLVSATALALSSPLLGMVTLLIKLTMPGPTLFRQERIGLRGRPFIVYKFRSMIVDAEARTGPVVARPGDARVTRLGRLLRRFSIDELPQLYNVLRGDMSLVGPRPQPTYFDAQYRREVSRYPERDRVRPGLTGWAEVNDLRGAAPIVDRTMYDVYYIENWSLKLDLKIVLLTIPRMLFQRHAY